MKLARGKTRRRFAYTKCRFPSWNVTHSSVELQKQWTGLEAGTEDESAEVSVAGRIMARRVFGKLAFFSIQVRAVIVCTVYILPNLRRWRAWYFSADRALETRRRNC